MRTGAVVGASGDAREWLPHTGQAVCCRLLYLGGSSAAAAAAADVRRHISLSGQPPSRCTARTCTARDQHHRPPRFLPAPLCRPVTLPCAPPAASCLAPGPQSGTQRALVALALRIYEPSIHRASSHGLDDVIALPEELLPASSPQSLNAVNVTHMPCAPGSLRAPFHWY